MIERLLLWLERALSPRPPRVTDDRYPMRTWRVLQRPFDQERDD